MTSSDPGLKISYAELARGFAEQGQVLWVQAGGSIADIFFRSSWRTETNKIGLNPAVHTVGRAGATAGVVAFTYFTVSQWDNMPAYFTDIQRAVVVGGAIPAGAAGGYAAGVVAGTAALVGAAVPDILYGAVGGLMLVAGRAAGALTQPRLPRFPRRRRYENNVVPFRRDLRASRAARGAGLSHKKL